MIFFSWLLYKPLIIHFCVTLCYTKSFWLPTNINRRLFSYYICLLSQNVHLSFPLSEFLMYIWKVTKTVTSHVLNTLTTGIIKTYLYKNTFDLFTKKYYQQTIILNRKNHRLGVNYDHIAILLEKPISEIDCHYFHRIDSIYTSKRNNVAYVCDWFYFLTTSDYINSFLFRLLARYWMPE